MAPWCFEVHPMDFLGGGVKGMPDHKVCLFGLGISFSFHLPLRIYPLKTSADVKVDYLDEVYTGPWLSDTTLQWFTFQQVSKLLVFQEAEALEHRHPVIFQGSVLSLQVDPPCFPGLFSAALKWVQVCGSLWFSDPILVVASWVCRCSQRKEMTIHSWLVPSLIRMMAQFALSFITVDVSRERLLT